MAIVRRMKSATEETGPRCALRSPVPWIAVALFLSVGFALFPGAGRDDAYISYWPAQFLAEHGSVANYNGEAVEQSSSATWVAVLAFFRAITGASLVTLGWLLGILAGVGTVLVLGQATANSESKPLRGAPLALALASPFVYWSFSGMETALQGLLLLTWVTLLTASPSTKLWRIGLFAVTLATCGIRPEAPLVLLCALLATTLLASSEQRRRLRFAWLALVVATGLWVTWRLVRFGVPLPQPALAKAGREFSTSLDLGLRALALTPLAAALSLFAVFAGVIGSIRTRGKSNAHEVRMGVAAAVVTAQLGFAVLSGGDWMEGARFLAPTLPLALFVVLGATRSLLGVGVLLALLIWSGAVFASSPSRSHFLAGSSSRSLFLWQDVERADSKPSPLSWCEKRNLVHLRDEPMLRAFREALEQCEATEPQLVLTGQGGLILFHLLSEDPERLEVVDRYGLLDTKLFSSPTARSHGASALGLKLGYKDLLGQWDAIWREAGTREPDFIFDVGIGQRDKVLLEQRGYVQIYAQSGELHAGSRRQPGKQFLFAKRSIAERLTEPRLESFEFSVPR